MPKLSPYLPTYNFSINYNAGGRQSASVRLPPVQESLHPPQQPASARQARAHRGRGVAAQARVRRLSQALQRRQHDEEPPGMEVIDQLYYGHVCCIGKRAIYCTLYNYIWQQRTALNFHLISMVFYTPLYIYKVHINCLFEKKNCPDYADEFVNNTKT